MTWRFADHAAQAETRLVGAFSGTFTGSLGTGVRSGLGGVTGRTAGFGICSGIVSGSEPGWCAIFMWDPRPLVRIRRLHWHDT